MGLSNDLISQFVKATKSDDKTSKETTVYGTTVEHNGTTYVKLDGSDLLTPVSTTSDTKPGERVTVMIKNHTATVTGNISSPSARSGDVKELGGQIVEFGTVMAHKVTTEDLEAAHATIESLKATTAKIKDAEIVNAEIHNLEAKFANLEYVDAKTVKALEADIENLRATFADLENISTENLEAAYADIDILKGYTADFTYVSADVLQAIKGDIQELDTKKLSAEEAEIKYANIDFTNIQKAAIEQFFTKSGMIENVVIGDSTITGALCGVTLKGDLIEGNTIKADKLVIKGSDGIYYKLNFEGGTFKDGEAVPTDSLHGSVITAKSIVAEKIDVKDLVAFDATIGGFKITDHAIHSVVKDSVKNTTRGIYMDNSGQFAVGDSNSFMKYHRVRASEQLANFDDAETDEINGVAWSSKDGIFTAKGTSTGPSTTSGILSCSVAAVPGPYTVSGTVVNNAQPYRTVSGETIVLNNVVDDKFRGLKLFGKSTQDGVPTFTKRKDIVITGVDGNLDVRMYGKNLFDHDEPSTTCGGLSCNKTDDGGYRFTGTASGPAGTYYMKASVPAGTVTIDGKEFTYDAIESEPVAFTIGYEDDAPTSVERTSAAVNLFTVNNEAVMRITPETPMAYAVTDKTSGTATLVSEKPADNYVMFTYDAVGVPTVYLYNAYLKGYDSRGVIYVYSTDINIVVLSDSTIDHRDYVGICQNMANISLAGPGKLTINSKGGTAIQVLTSGSLTIEEDANIDILRTSTTGIHVGNGNIIAKGNVKVSGGSSNAIYAKTGLMVKSGSIEVIPTATGTYVYSENVVVSGGSLSVIRGAGLGLSMTYGIKATNMIFTGGSVTTNTGRGLVASGDVTISGGSHNFDVNWNASIYVVQASTFTITGGEVTITAGGASSRLSNVDIDLPSGSGYIAKLGTSQATATDVVNTASTVASNCYFYFTRPVNEFTTLPSIDGWLIGQVAKTPACEAKYGNVVFSYATSIDGNYTANSAPWEDNIELTTTVFTDGTYTLSIDASSFPDKGVMYQHHRGDTQIKMEYDRAEQTYTASMLKGDTLRVLLATTNGTTVDSTVYVQLELGDHATEFEKCEFTALTALTPNGLSGMPVDTGGNYTDPSGQQWLCDEIDFIRGVRVTRYGVTTLRTLEWYITTIDGQRMFYTDTLTSIANPPRGNTYKGNLLCSHFPVETMDSADGRQDVMYMTSEGRLCINNRSLGAMSIFNAAVGHAILVYELATPIETPLTVEEMAQYADLHISHLTTTVINDENADMDVSYYVDVAPKVYVSVKKGDAIQHYVNETFTLDGTEEKVEIYCQLDEVGVTVDATVYPMLNEGTEALPWEPFKYGHEYKLEISANSIILAATNKTIDDTISDRMNEIRVGARNLIRNSTNLIFSDYYFSGELVHTYDGNGNVTITCGATATDDESGNVVMRTGVTVIDDGAGNVVIM